MNLWLNHDLETVRESDPGDGDMKALDRSGNGRDRDDISERVLQSESRSITSRYSPIGARLKHLSARPITFPRYGQTDLVDPGRFVAMLREIGFALDSLLEQAGFELAVPP